MFYVWAFALLATGALLVVVALTRRAGSHKEAAQEQTVAALYQDRLAELRSEMAGGLAEDADKAVLEAELGAALLSDYESLASRGNRQSVERGSLLLPVIVGGLLLLGALIVYQQVGDPQAMRLAGAEAVLRLDPSRDQAALDRWREVLNRRVDARPEDAKSWYLLGHVDLKLGRFASAAEAFSMASRAHGPDPSIDVYWLQARYLAAEGKMDATTRSIAERVLAENPNQPMVLEMYAIDAYQNGSYRESVSLLNRALSGDLESAHRQALEAGYAEARKHLGDLPASVDVDIRAEGRIPEGATLFVIARPVGGGMPFAVVRRPAGSFPRTVRLDDAVSMNPAAPLSSAQRFEVVVRLSRSGTAMAHPGDWQWQSPPLELAGQAHPATLEATLKPPA
jgi:cytochrome c-type biogenesis protein CcmH